jgi:hypothetical protein
MCVLRDLAHQGAAILLGHPVLGLDFFFGVDARLERLELLGRVHRFALRRGLVFLIKTLRVHPASRIGI